MDRGLNQVSRVYKRLRAANLDGWLLYDFRGINPFPLPLLNITNAMFTRRWFLLIPANGAPTIIHHRIKAATWAQVLPDVTITRKVSFAHQELDALLRATLANAKRIAMECSPRGVVPYVS